MLIIEAYSRIMSIVVEMPEKSLPAGRQVYTACLRGLWGEVRLLPRSLCLAYNMR